MLEVGNMSLRFNRNGIWNLIYVIRSLEEETKSFCKYTLMRIALILAEEKISNNNKKKQRFWIHGMLENRQKERELFTFYRRLVGHLVMMI